jgi:hypothetical protein
MIGGIGTVLPAVTGGTAVRVALPAVPDHKRRWKTGSVHPFNLSRRVEKSRARRISSRHNGNRGRKRKQSPSLALLLLFGAKRSSSWEISTGEGSNSRWREECEKFFYPSRAVLALVPKLRTAGRKICLVQRSGILDRARPLKEKIEKMVVVEHLLALSQTSRMCLNEFSLVAELHSLSKDLSPQL